MVDLDAVRTLPGALGLPSPDPYDLALLLGGLAVVGSILAVAPLRRVRLRVVLVFVAAGVLAGPHFFDIALLGDLDNIVWLERVSEFAVIVSLLVAGLKVGRHPRWSTWSPTIRLILLAMPLSIAVIALTGHLVLGLAVGPAILLGAILAPTDPVTAGGIQLEDHADDEEMRFGVTTEAGLNDGFAFPFVYLGLLATQQPEAWGTWLEGWFVRDLLYRVGIALPLGWFLGAVAARVYLERRERGRLGRNRALLFPPALLIASYGFVEMIGGYGFLAAFTLGLAMRRTVDDHPEVLEDWLTFAATLEEVAGATLLFLLGAFISWPLFVLVGWKALLFGLVAILLVRPFVVLLATTAGSFATPERFMWAWFGARGVGSVYYLSYALGQGVAEDAALLFGATVITVILSLLLHGATLDPALRWYARESGR